MAQCNKNHSKIEWSCWFERFIEWDAFSFYIDMTNAHKLFFYYDFWIKPACLLFEVTSRRHLSSPSNGDAMTSNQHQQLICMKMRHHHHGGKFLLESWEVARCSTSRKRNQIKLIKAFAITAIQSQLNIFFNDHYAHVHKSKNNPYLTQFISI